jgi:hypothetical protein
MKSEDDICHWPKISVDRQLRVHMPRFSNIIANPRVARVLLRIIYKRRTLVRVLTVVVTTPEILTISISRAASMERLALWTSEQGFHSVWKSPALGLYAIWWRWSWRLWCWSHLLLKWWGPFADGNIQLASHKSEIGRGPITVQYCYLVVWESHSPF